MHAVVAQLVEHQLPKLRVTSSSLAYRSESKKPLTINFCRWLFLLLRNRRLNRYCCFICQHHLFILFILIVSKTGIIDEFLIYI